MTTIVAIKANNGVVLASDKRASKGFFIGSKEVQKIYKLDDNLGMAMAGLMSDAEYVINVVKAERNLARHRRGFPLSVRESAKLVSNMNYSAMKSFNPYYTELLVAGNDAEGPHVFSSDMSGSITTEEFTSSGSGSPMAYGVLESSFKSGLSVEEAKELGERAVRAAMERDPGSGGGVDIVAFPINGVGEVKA
jgi:proteasome beta subunit